jgi:hypothetical protein
VGTCWLYGFPAGVVIRTSWQSTNEADWIKLPMTIMVLDQNNDAVRITLDATGRTWH